MELNYFIFIGLVLRYLYYWSNNTYTMEYLKTKLWKTILFSFVVTVVFFQITFYVNLGLFTEWWHEAFIAIVLVFVGWSIDSVFLSIMKLLNNKFNKMVTKEDDKPS